MSMVGTNHTNMYIKQKCFITSINFGLFVIRQWQVIESLQVTASKVTITTKNLEWHWPRLFLFYLFLIGLCHPLDGDTNPKNKLFYFLTAIFCTKRRYQLLTRIFTAIWCSVYGWFSSIAFGWSWRIITM